MYNAIALRQMPNHKAEGMKGRDRITTTNVQMQGLQLGGGRSGQSVFSQLWDRQARALTSPPPPSTFSPTSLLTYSPTPKIPFTLLTPVFNLSPPGTSTVCSLGNTVTPLPSLLVTLQRKGGRKSPELNDHSVLQQSGGCV